MTTVIRGKLMTKLINPKALRLVVLGTDVGPDGLCKQVHVCKYDIRNRKVTKTACGLGNVKEAYAFPFWRSLWENRKAKICENCYQNVNGKINN